MKYLILLILFFLLLSSTITYASIVIGISPVKQNICVAPGETKNVEYIVSTNSSQIETLSVYVLNLTWIKSDKEIDVLPKIGKRLILSVSPPIELSEGSYGTTIMVCKFYPGMIGLKGCLEGELFVNISEECSLYKKYYLLIFLLDLMAISIAVLMVIRILYS
ncbi:MAG: hypothetical protein ACE5J4_00870 [Candidatus Aenigmatarchaeota archaeon]